MEPADNSNQTSGTTPDLERLADELTKANVPTMPPSPESTSATPTPEPVSPTPTPEPTPIASPAAPDMSTSSPVPDLTGPVPSPIDASSAQPAPASPLPSDPSPIVSSAPAPSAPMAPTAPSPEPATSPVAPPVDFSTPSMVDPMTNAATGVTPEAALGALPTDSQSAAFDTAQTPGTPVPMDASAPMDTPIQPAAPVPGSIGSSQSYMDPVAQPAPEEKPKLSRTTIIIIILAVVVLIGGIVLAIILMTSNSSQSQTVNTGGSQYQPVVEETEPVISGLTCIAADPDTAYLATIGNPKPFEGSIKISFVDDEFTNWTQSINATYSSPEEAANGLTLLQAQYDTGVSDAGLTADPMVTSYSISKNVLLLTHSVDIDNLTIPAAQYMGIDVTDIASADELDLSYDTLESLYTTLGYTCSATEDDELEEVDIVEETEGE